jgi:hypothetical protein
VGFPDFLVRLFHFEISFWISCDQSFFNQTFDELRFMFINSVSKLLNSHHFSWEFPFVVRTQNHRSVNVFFVFKVLIKQIQFLLVLNLTSFKFLCPKK